LGCVRSGLVGLSGGCVRVGLGSGWVRLVGLGSGMGRVGLGLVGAGWLGRLVGSGLGLGFVGVGWLGYG